MFIIIYDSWCQQLSLAYYFNWLNWSLKVKWIQWNVWSNRNPKNISLGKVNENVPNNYDLLKLCEI